MGTRVWRQRIGVFWHGVPTIVMVVRLTTAGPHASVCAPFLFAHTVLLVLVFRLIYIFRKYDTTFSIILSKNISANLFSLHRLIIALIDIFDMSLAEAISCGNSHVDQLRSFVDEVTREVAILQDKFDH